MQSLSAADTYDITVCFYTVHALQNCINWLHVLLFQAVLLLGTEVQAPAWYCVGCMLGIHSALITSLLCHAVCYHIIVGVAHLLLVEQLHITIKR